MLKKGVRITEEKQWCESCQQCVNNVPRCLMKGVIRGEKNNLVELNGFFQFAKFALLDGFLNPAHVYQRLTLRSQ